MIASALADTIRFVVLDVDGVLTDGGIYLGAVDGRPLEFKRYDIQDGLGIEDIAQDPSAQKLPPFLAMLDRHGIAPSETAFIGDDFPDLAVLRLVGLPVAVANAVPEVKKACAVHLTRTGGAGAVREFAELLLKARDEWDYVTERYVAERSLPISGSGT